MKKGDNHLLESIKLVMVPIHKEGTVVIAIAFSIAFVFLMFSNFLGILFMILAVFCLYFFRDPERVVPKGEGLVISPADGTVQTITRNIALPKDLSMGDSKKWTRVSIFLNVFNVHVQRVPISGKIIKSHYNKGLFLNATLDKASEQNERQSCVVEAKNGQRIGFIQIAGLIARRIVCDLEEGQKVNTGDRYGLIKFGSRVDIYLPEGVSPQVYEGQTMIGGETVIAELKVGKVAKSVPVKKVVAKKIVKSSPVKKVIAKKIPVKKSTTKKTSIKKVSKTKK
jgi:phosphatidylserine decarboxylase